MKNSLQALLVIAAILNTGCHSEELQDWLLDRGARTTAVIENPAIDGLNVFVCGSASPLPAPGRAQACLAVLTPEHYFVVDAGSGSANNLGLGGLPAERLDGVLLTHFHSDHIVDLPTMNVQAWASGHEGALKVYGPTGVDTVVDGFNHTLSHDRRYRTTHHGADFMPPEWGVMEAMTIDPDTTLTFGDLTITVFPASHDPVDPAVSYRFDYRGRSVVITGDTVVTSELETRVRGADLLLADALSLPIVTALQKATADAGRWRISKILGDIQEYHAASADIVALHEKSQVSMTALYHLVPAPRNPVMAWVFERGFSDDMLLTEDGMWLRLPADSGDIEVD